jgi:PHP family Zn ribbon phosphoesterase
MNRVEQLAKRPADFFDPQRPGFKKLVTLDEIIADALGVGKVSKSVFKIYKDLILNFGNELNVLLNAPLQEIKLASNELIAEGVKRVRERKLYIFPGYDGEYGKVYIFEENERKKFSNSAVKQKTLF